MLVRLLAALVASLTLFSWRPETAAAEESKAREIAGVIERQAQVWVPATIERTRRSFAIGPLAGGHTMVPTGAEAEVDGVLSFGLELLYFEVPSLLDPGSVKQLLLDRAKAKLAEAVERSALRGEELSEEEIEEMGREILEETREELIGERSRLVEKPRFQLLVEGDRLFRSDAWQARATLALGLSYFSIGPSFAAQFGDGTGVFLGPEVGFYLLPNEKSPRSPVVQLFARWDLALHERNERADRVEVGAKVLLDVL